jgi:CheY-like chemotaxis protein
VLKKIRTNALTKSIPVLVLTTLKDFADVQKAINLGANYYSIKGSDPPEKLLGMIDKLLKKKTAPAGA